MPLAVANDDKIWKTRDGREIPVGLMTDDHLKNTFKMLKRRNFQRKSTILNCLAYAATAPDGAAMAAEAEASAMRYNPQAVYIFDEVERRGLACH